MGNYCFNGYKISVWGDEKVMEKDSGNGFHDVVSIINATELNS